MGTAGRRRIEEKLAWSHQEPQYLSVYDRLLRRRPDGPRVNASHAS
jgi:hypothetical protein